MRWQVDEAMTMRRRIALAVTMLGVLALSLGAAAWFTYRPEQTFMPLRLGMFELQVPTGWHATWMEGLGAEEVVLFSDPHQAGRQMILAVMQPRERVEMTAALEDAMLRFVPTRIARARWHTQAFEQPQPMIRRVGESTDGRQRYSHAVAVVRGEEARYLVIALTTTVGDDGSQIERDTELVSRMMNSLKVERRTNEAFE